MASDCTRGGLGWTSRGFLYGKGGLALELLREVMESPCLEVFKEQLDIALTCCGLVDRVGISHRLDSDPGELFQAD